MLKNDNRKKFELLREKYPVFKYEGFDVDRNKSGIKVVYHFNAGREIRFNPELFIPFSKIITDSEISSRIESTLFHIGMVEAISYWKATCSPVFEVFPYYLNKDQKVWWEKLFYLGLGEFRYINSIDIDQGSFIHIESHSSEKLSYHQEGPFAKRLIPVGGGKDSAVTLELLKEKDSVPFLLNPNPAMKRTVQAAGFSIDDAIVFKRSLDESLLELNRKGFLNGHTPFSALIAFLSILAAQMSKAGEIALSNESSANQVTVPGTDINHQYSKSFEFETAFRNYVNNHIARHIKYYSFLRPLNELQIASLFSAMPHYFEVFRSCNVGSKEDIWCNKCSKCLFAYIILAPFLDSTDLQSIFDANLLDDPDLKETLNMLAGKTEHKPFECIGTVEEINTALIYLSNILPANRNQLLKNDTFLINDHVNTKNQFVTYLKSLNTNHHVPDELMDIIKKKMNERMADKQF